MSEAAEVKLFGKWSLEDVEINDIALEVRPRCPSDALTDGAGAGDFWRGRNRENYSFHGPSRCPAAQPPNKRRCFLIVGAGVWVGGGCL